MDPTPTEPQSNYDGRNDLQKVIHSFVFGGEAPSKETENRATFLKSFLAEYYNTALKGTDYSVSNPESGYAHSCTNTSTCNINSPCNASTTTNEVNTCNNTYDDKDSAAVTSRARTTEHPTLFNSLNSTDEAERLNSMRDMASKLAVKLSGVCKELTKGTATISASNIVKNVLKISNPAQSDSQNKEVGDLSQHLQLFVDNINESLHMLGTTGLTEEELKLLLAAAPLPTIDTELSESDPITRPRSLSAGEILTRTASPRNLVSRRLKHSVSEGVRHVTRDAKPLVVTSTINEESNSGAATPDNDELLNKRPFLSLSGGLNSSGEVVVTRPRSLSLENETGLNLSGEHLVDSAEGTPTGTPGKSKRRLSSFFTKKMESFTNLLDNIEFAERDDTTKMFTKSKSFIGPRSGASTPSKSGCGTPRSGYATPHDTSTENEELNVASLRQKLEQVEKALCDEVVVRAAAEQKATQACDLVCRLKTDLDRVQSQKETVAVINKQMSVELRFLRQRNSKTTRDRQQWEDALVGETKKRRALEEQMHMLIKSYQERNVNSAPPEDGELTNKQQEEVFSKQREEVLLAVIESLREQLHTADSEMERARNEWQEERAKYQETHDLLRFQLDQLTLTRQQATGKDTELGEEADEIIKNRDVPMSRQLRHQVSVHDLREQMDNTETKKETEKPVTERMKLFFLSSSWWPKFDFMSNSAPSPTRPPVLLMQIAWWVSELREYATTHQDTMKALVSGHSMNQFCACSDCMKV